jgi:hypothetical protein
VVDGAADRVGEQGTGVELPEGRHVEHNAQPVVPERGNGVVRTRALCQ